MLGILGKACDALEAGKGVDPQHLDQILEFLMVFVDRCHHAKEEERVGHGKHEEFHRMMDRLKVAYRI